MSSVPTPSGFSDLSDGDFTLFWQGDGWEASLSFSAEGMETHWGFDGGRETYSGPFSQAALERLFDRIPTHQEPEHER